MFRPLCPVLVPVSIVVMVMVMISVATGSAPSWKLSSQVVFVSKLSHIMACGSKVARLAKWGGSEWLELFYIAIFGNVIAHTVFLLPATSHHLWNLQMSTDGSSGVISTVSKSR